MKFGHVTHACSTIFVNHRFIGWVHQKENTTIIQLKDESRYDIGRHSLACGKPASDVPGREALITRIEEILEEKPKGKSR